MTFTHTFSSHYIHFLLLLLGYHFFLWLVFSPLICLNSRLFIFINFPPLLPFFSISGTCLDGGEVAGIVIGCFLLLLLLLILFIFLWRRRNRGRRRRGISVFPVWGVLFHSFYKYIGIFCYFIFFNCCSTRSAEK